MSAPAKEAPPAADAAAKAKGGSPIVPLLLVVVLVPALCFATTQYILLPKLKAAMGANAAAPAEEPAEAGHGAAPEAKGEAKKEGGHGKEAKAGGGHGGGGEKAKNGSGKYPYSHEFNDVIVNLAGAKQTRYLRVKFTLASNDKSLDNLIITNENQLRDLAIGVLGQQTLETLEAPGARNAIRNELIAQFNHTLNGEVVEQIYFTEFVVQ